MINYTQAAKERCLNLTNADADAIWDDISRVPDDTPADLWAKKINALAQEYVYSSRFALMRLFLDRENINISMNAPESATGIPADLSCGITDITMEHAQNLSKQELNQLKSLLLTRAATQADADPVADKALIDAALSPAKTRTHLLSREDALRLGHSLQFSLDEMEWFLLRVLDRDDGFRYNLSNDLIEAYGFLTGHSAKAVAALKDAYRKTYGDVSKVAMSDKPPYWTEDAGDSLPDLVANTWAKYDAVEQDKQFLAWLGEQAPYLDLPSNTAVQVYRNLAAFTYQLVKGTVDVPGTDLVRCVRSILYNDDDAILSLCNGGTLSNDPYDEIASTLLTENKNLFYTHPDDDRVHAWVIPYVKSTGKITVNDGKKETRTRIRDILAGNVVHVEKGDMLYLLWFLSNLCWLPTSGRPESAEVVSARLNDFTHAAKLCLAAAHLPAFYPPHVIEQSMMLATVYGCNKYYDCEPGYIYEIACAALRGHKAGAATT